MRTWPLTKITDMSEQFKKKSYKPGELIYDLGDKVDDIYFIFGVKVSLDFHYLVQTKTTFPVSGHQVCRNTQN